MVNKIIVTKSVHKTINVELQGSFPEETLHFFRSMDVWGSHGEILEIRSNRIYRRRYELPLCMYLLFDELPFIQRDHIVVEYPLEKVVTSWEGLVGLKSPHCTIDVNLKYGNAHINPIDEYDEALFPHIYLTTHTFYNAESCRDTTEMMNNRYGFDVILRCPELYSVSGKKKKN